MTASISPSASACSATRRVWSLSARSPTTTWAPWSSRSRTAASRSRLRVWTTTSCPSCRSVRAVARPRPSAEPVMRMRATGFSAGTPSKLAGALPVQGSPVPRRLACPAKYRLDQASHPLVSRAWSKGRPLRTCCREAEALLRCSDVEWVALRRPRLVDRAATGRYRVDADRPLRRARSMTYAELAAALLDALDRAELHHRAVVHRRLGGGRSCERLAGVGERSEAHADLLDERLSGRLYRRPPRRVRVDAPQRGAVPFPSRAGGRP